ncbi:hypothetical protein [Nitrospirillum amazonense]|uniref:hypothetical protein n=1 Tax=Nitrospirillum amazonense TaxID=28077 RepID=UPI002412A5A5|nr:hypothetical protein [Nitrospirillum amazonense]MDG3442446.1 hypothetical protein [Nitrospirillum amazonense]
MTDQVVSIRLDADASTVQVASARAEAALKSLYNTLNAGAPAARSMSVETQRYVEQVDGSQRTLRVAQDQFQAVSDALEAGQISSNEATRAFKGIEEAALEASHGTEQLSLSTVGARRELVVLAHEMATGNFARVPGSLMVMAERMGGLSLSTMGAAGAVAALGYAAYEAVDKLQHMDDQVVALSGHMAAIGRGQEFTPGVIKERLKDLQDGLGLSKDSANALANALDVGLAGASRETIRELGDLTAAASHLSGLKIDDLGREVAAAWRDGAPAIETLNKQLQILSADEIEALESARTRADQQEIFSAAMRRRFGAEAEALRGVAAQAKEVGSVYQTMGENLPVGPEQNAPTATTGNNQKDQDRRFNDSQLVKETTTELAQLKATWTASKDELLAVEAEKWQRVISLTVDGSAAQREARRALAAVEADQVRQSITTFEAAEREKVAARAATGTQGRADELRDQIALDDRLLASDQLTSERKLQIAAERARTMGQLRQQESADAITAVRDQLAAESAAGTQTRAQQLQAQIAADQQLLASGKLTADARLGVEREINVAKAQLANEQAKEELRSLQEQATAARAGSAERIALLREELTYAQAHFGALSAEAKTAQDALTTAEREGKKEREAIQREEAATQLRVSQAKLTAERERLDGEVAAGRITEQQKLQALKDLAAAEYELNLQALTQQRDSLDQGTLAWTQANGKIEVLAAQHSATMEKLAAQTEQANTKAAQASLRAWESALAPITRAWDTSLSGVVQGTQTVQQAFGKMGQSILLEEITSASKWLEHKALVNALGVANDNRSAQGGLAAWLLADRAKTTAATAGEATRTAATTTGAAARTSATAAESGGFLGRLGTMIAGWLGLETGKTAATDAGVIERTAADKAEGLMQTTKAAGEIQIAAAVAGANAYAQYAGVPPLAAAMAAEAVGAVQAFNSMLAVGGGLASAAGGWERVPYDGALAELHKNEMVLPASIATPLRAAVATWRNPPANDYTANGNKADSAGFAASAPPMGDTHVHVHAIDSQSVARFFAANKHHVADAMKAAHRNGKR